MKIGNVELPGKIILAPMAGVSDLPFRLLCHEQGAGMVCMEMISAKAIHYKNRNTEDLMKIHPDEGIVSLQLFGSEPKLMAEIARQIEDRPFQILDINMGCPVPKIVNNHEGSALMKEPKLVYEIVKEISSAISKPVTVKFRRGFNEDNINAVEIARICEEAGAAAVAIHGRTREQFYSGKADWDIIRQAKEAVSIPVIGNGDVVDGHSAERMLKETGCDAVMVGRAAQGNPFIFKKIDCYLKGLEYTEPTLEEWKSTILRHAQLQLEYKGEYIGIREMRKHLSWYLKGFDGACALRKKINEMEVMDELVQVVESLEK